MNVSYLFPGQGSQRPGMFGRLPKHPSVVSVLQEAEQVLNLNVAEMDSESSLQCPVNVQLSLLIAGVASARALAAQDVIPMAVAGLSVGAFAAAVACETLLFSDALIVVRERANMMSGAFPSGYGMAAVVGLTERRLSEIVFRLNSQEHPVYLSNINSPNQLLVSGSVESLARVEAAALSLGARKVERLAVNVPSHCPLFDKVADDLRASLNRVPKMNPKVPFIGNVRARPLRTAQQVCDDLALNVARGVRWHDSVSVLVELGTRIFVEAVPGSVLCRLSSEFFPQQRFIALEDSSPSFIHSLASNLN